MEQMEHEHSGHGHGHRRHKKRSKHVLRQSISYVMAFLLSVCLALITLLFVVKFGCFSEKALYKNMSSYGYYDYVYKDIMSDIKSMTIPTGFPETVYQDVITQTYIYTDVNGSLKAQFKGEEYTSKASDIKQQLRANIDKYFAENAYTATEQEESAINDYLNAVVDDYDGYIQMPLGNYLIQIKDIFDKVFMIALIVLAVVSLIIIYVILQLYKWPHRAFRFFSYAAFGAGAMVTVFPAYLYVKKIHYRFSLSPESFYKLITTYIDNVLELFIYFGLLWLAVGIVCICVTILTKKYKKIQQQ